MNKEVLEKLLAIVKETSAQDVWEQIKKIEEAIQGSLDEVENLEDIIVAQLQEEIDEHEENEKSFDYSKVEEVIASKGLPALDGNVVRKRMGLSFPKMAGDSTQVKGAKGKAKAEDYYPTPEELSLINKYTNVDLKKEEVLVFTLSSANQDVDRASDQFTAKALKDMAELSADKPYLENHDWDIKSVKGKIFDAKVANKQLIQKVYVPIQAENESFIKGMLNGLLNKVSVGFSMAPKDYVCSSCNKSLYSMECPHYPGGKDKEGKPIVGIIKGVADYFEISNVAVPCQRDAGMRRSLPAMTMDQFIDSDLTVEEIGTVIPDEEQPPVASEKTVDRISNEIKLHGESPVSEVNQEETEVLEQKAEEAPAEPEVKAVVEEENPLKAVAKELASTLAAELSASLKEVIAELKATIKEKVEAEKSAEDESTEEIVRKLAATKVDNSAPATPAIDYTKSGWMAGVLNKINQ